MKKNNNQLITVKSNFMLNTRIYAILVNDVLVQTKFPLAEQLSPTSFNWWLCPTIGAAYFNDKEGKQVLPLKKELGVNWSETMANQVSMEVFDAFRQE